MIDIKIIRDTFKNMKNVSDEVHKMNVEFTNWVIKETVKDAFKYLLVFVAFFTILYFIFV